MFELIRSAVLLLATLSYAKAAEPVLPSNNECGILRASQYNNDAYIAELNEFPWMSLIGYKAEGGTNVTHQHCAAVLISRSHLLTPAHCVTDNAGDYKPVAVFLGETDLFNGIHVVDCEIAQPNKCADLPQQHDIAKIAIHPEYRRGKFHNDIALLTLQAPVALSDYIKPICLPENGKFNSTATSALMDTFQRAVITGWTRSEEMQRKLKGFMLSQNQEDCQFMKIAASEICGNSCIRGMLLSSGSALMQVDWADDGEPKNFYLTGLLSYGVNKCDITSVFMSIDAFEPWILENLRV